MSNNIPKDPMILYSYINTKLRDEYRSFDELCNDLDLDKQEIETKLAEAGFEYNVELNKFY